MSTLVREFCHQLVDVIKVFSSSSSSQLTLTSCTKAILSEFSVNTEYSSLSITVKRGKTILNISFAISALKHTHSLSLSHTHTHTHTHTHLSMYNFIPLKSMWSTRYHARKTKQFSWEKINIF